MTVNVGNPEADLTPEKGRAINAVAELLRRELSVPIFIWSRRTR